MNSAAGGSRAELARLIELQRAAYRRSLPATFAQMQALWDQAQRSRAGPALGELQRLAHTLYGTAGTYGLGDVSQAGARLDEAVQAAAATPGAIPPPLQARVTAALAALHLALPRGAPGQQAP